MPASPTEFRARIGLFYCVQINILSKKLKIFQTKSKNEPRKSNLSREKGSWTACSIVLLAYALSVTVLLQANDIESNPGPASNCVNEFQSLGKAQEEGFQRVLFQIFTLHSKIDFYWKAFANLQDEVTQKLQQQDKVLENIELHNRKNNIKFIGITEDDVDSVPSTDKVIKLLNKYSMDPSWKVSDIAYAHRIGDRNPKKNNSPRPLVVSFRLAEDKSFIMRDKHLRKDLRDYEDIKLAADLTHKQQEELTYYRNKGITAYYKQGRLCLEDENGNDPRLNPTDNYEQNIHTGINYNQTQRHSYDEQPDTELYNTRQNSRQHGLTNVNHTNYQPYDQNNNTTELTGLQNSHAGYDNSGNHFGNKNANTWSMNLDQLSRANEHYGYKTNRDDTKMRHGQEDQSIKHETLPRQTTSTLVSGHPYITNDESTNFCSAVPLYKQYPNITQWNNAESGHNRYQYQQPDSEPRTVNKKDAQTTFEEQRNMKPWKWLESASPYPPTYPPPNYSEASRILNHTNHNYLSHIDQSKWSPLTIYPKENELVDASPISTAPSDYKTEEENLQSQTYPKKFSSDKSYNPETSEAQKTVTDNGLKISDVLKRKKEATRTFKGDVGMKSTPIKGYNFEICQEKKSDLKNSGYPFSYTGLATSTSTRNKPEITCGNQETINAVSSGSKRLCMKKLHMTGAFHHIDIAPNKSLDYKPPNSLDGVEKTDIETNVSQHEENEDEEFHDTSDEWLAKVDEAVLTGDTAHANAETEPHKTEQNDDNGRAGQGEQEYNTHESRPPKLPPKSQAPTPTTAAMKDITTDKKPQETKMITDTQQPTPTTTKESAMDSKLQESIAAPATNTQKTELRTETPSSESKNNTKKPKNESNESKNRETEKRRNSLPSERNQSITRRQSLSAVTSAKVKTNLTTNTNTNNPSNNKNKNNKETKEKNQPTLTQVLRSRTNSTNDQK